MVGAVPDGSEHAHEGIISPPGNVNVAARTDACDGVHGSGAPSSLNMTVPLGKGGTYSLKLQPSKAGPPRFCG